MRFYDCSWLHIYILPSSTYLFRLFCLSICFFCLYGDSLNALKKKFKCMSMYYQLLICIYIHDFRSDRISKSSMGNTWISDVSPISIKWITSVSAADTIRSDLPNNLCCCLEHHPDYWTEGFSFPWSINAWIKLSSSLFLGSVEKGSPYEFLKSIMG